MIYLAKKSVTKHKIMKKFLLTTILTVLLITSFALSPLPAEAQRVTASVDASVDINKIYRDVSKSINGLRTRDACVKAIRETAYSKVKQNRNVMVFNLSQNYEKNLKNAKFKQFSCAGYKYGLWIFKSGRFVNKGDGGFINWAFDGNWKRTGRDQKTVVFRPIRK
jgi:uncharacterized lipoprotein YajG